MEPPPQTSVGAGTPRALTAQLRRVGELLQTWGASDSEDAEELALSYRLDRFVESAVEIAMFVAVAALFIMVLV